jgi:hypothetical protein
MSTTQTLFLEIDNVRIGEIENFVYTPPRAPDVWGPVWPHHKKTPPFCTFEVSGPVAYEGFHCLVNAEGEAVYELKLHKVDFQMGLGSTTSRVQALIVTD